MAMSTEWQGDRGTKRTGREPQDADPQIAIDESLAAAGAGRHVRITGLHAGRAANRRLAELGLRSGSVVQVLQNQRNDGVIVGLGNERLALPSDLARCIRITEQAVQVAPTAPGQAR